MLLSQCLKHNGDESRANEESVVKISEAYSTVFDSVPGRPNARNEKTISFDYCPLLGLNL